MLGLGVSRGNQSGVLTLAQLSAPAVVQLRLSRSRGFSKLSADIQRLVVAAPLR